MKIPKKSTEKIKIQKIINQRQTKSKTREPSGFRSIHLINSDSPIRFFFLFILAIFSEHYLVSPKNNGFREKTYQI